LYIDIHLEVLTGHWI